MAAHKYHIQNACTYNFLNLNSLKFRLSNQKGKSLETTITHINSYLLFTSPNGLHFHESWTCWHHTELHKNLKSWNSVICFSPFVFPGQKNMANFANSSSLWSKYKYGAWLFWAAIIAEFCVFRSLSNCIPSLLFFCLICRACQMMRCFLAAQENANYRTTDVVCPLKWARITYLIWHFVVQGDSWPSKYIINLSHFFYYKNTMLALSKLIFIRKQQQKMDIYSFNDWLYLPLSPLPWKNLLKITGFQQLCFWPLKLNTEKGISLFFELIWYLMSRPFPPTFFLPRLSILETSTAPLLSIMYSDHKVTCTRGKSNILRILE